MSVNWLGQLRKFYDGISVYKPQIMREHPTAFNHEPVYTTNALNETLDFLDTLYQVFSSVKPVILQPMSDLERYNFQSTVDRLQTLYDKFVSVDGCYEILREIPDLEFETETPLSLLYDMIHASPKEREIIFDRIYTGTSSIPDFRTLHISKNLENKFVSYGPNSTTIMPSLIQPTVDEYPYPIKEKIPNYIFEFNKRHEEAILSKILPFTPVINTHVINREVPDQYYQEKWLSKFHPNINMSLKITNI